MREHIRKLAGQSFLYGLPEILNNAARMALIPIYTYYLDPADLGILSLTVAFAALLSNVNKLGTHSAYIKHYHDLEGEEERRAYTGSLAVFVVLYNVVLAALMTLIGLYIAKGPLAGVSFDPYYKVVIWAMCFAGLDFVVMTRMRARERAGYHFVFVLLRFAVSTSLTIILIALVHQRALGRLNAMLYTSVLFFGVCIVLLRDTFARASLHHVKKALGFGLPLVPFYITAWLLTTTDRWSLGYLGNLGDVGLYDLGFRFAQVMWLLVVVAEMAVMPHFFALAKENRKRELGRLAGIYAAFMMMAALVVAGLGSEGIFLLATKKFHASASVVPTLALAFLARGFQLFPMCSIHLREATRKTLPLSLGAAAANIVLNFVLIRYLGMQGAAIATVISMSILWLATHAIGQKLYRLHYDYTLIIPAGIVTSVALAAYLVMPVLASALLTRWIRLGIVLAGAVFIFGLILHHSGRGETEPERL